MTLDDATAVISRIGYKPGWYLTVLDRPGGPTLVIDRPGGPDGFGVKEYAPLPLMSVRTMTVRSLVFWVFGWLRDLEYRRTEQAFRYNGQALGEVDGP